VKTPPSGRRATLLRAIGIDPQSFEVVLEWAIGEHLVSVLSSIPELDTTLFAKPDALKRFRTILEQRTKRQWSHHDLSSLFDRIKLEKEQNFREPISYEEYLRLIWQVPLECASCRRHPPEVVLHVDHIVPASRGGSSRRVNLQFLCATHNLKKGAKREVSGPWLDLL
jgi:5-methylcytosine-specific restriction endonuclease McrA